MGKAEIIKEYPEGFYGIRRLFAGREEVEARVSALNRIANEMQVVYDEMPEVPTTETELIEKRSLTLRIASIRKQASYLTNNFPDDIEDVAFCADATTGLSGEVGTADIPGEMTAGVNIRPGYDYSEAFDPIRDGEFWPSIAMGPWTSLYNQMILPGWQKWYPKYRYAWIVPNSINYEDNTCAITIQPAFSSQQGLDVNQDDGFGAEIIEEEREISYFHQPSVPAYPGFQDFCARNPDNPICSNSDVGEPVELTEGQMQAIDDINFFVNTAFTYESDQSGYNVGEYFDIMQNPWTDTGDCEDYALTKMNMIIEAGILPAKNVQLIFCEVLGEDGGGHAVAGIQTTNRGFLILDNRFEAVMKKTTLSGFYRWEDFQLSGSIIVNVQRLKGDVPIEYMNCNAGAFEDADEVLVEFTGQDWTQPKVIGFKEFPAKCGIWSMFGGEPLDITAYNYKPAYDLWIVKANELQHFSGLYFFEIPQEWADAHAWYLPVIWPIHIKYAPMITKTEGKIFSFGGWFDNGDYFEDKHTTSNAIDTCERFDLTTGVWSRRNKDDYIGRSCGAGWAMNGKSYISGGAFYDDRIDTYFPHVELELNYVWGDYEAACSSPPQGHVNVEPTPYLNSHYKPDYNANLQNFDALYQGFMARYFDFENGGTIDACGGMPPGAHSSPPGGGRPYGVASKLSEGPYVFYIWFDHNPQWGKNGKRWYENQLFGECLQYSDDTNSYSQKASTTPTMMAGSFQLENMGYMVGGTQEEISDIIRSADIDGMTNDLRKYNADTNIWTSLNDFYENILYPSGFEASGKGYIFSGYSETSHAGSISQLFGHEHVPLDWVNGRGHPMSSWYGGSGGAGQSFQYTNLPGYGNYPAETVELHCTNRMHEYDSITNAWTRKNDASTPSGNCRYREFYNHFGTITVPYFYTLNERNCLVKRYFEEAREGGDQEYLYYHELENPGPYDETEHGGPAPLHKQQHIHRYPAESAGNSGGFIFSIDYMAEYNHMTDSYSVRDPGLKDHLDGGMVS